MLGCVKVRVVNDKKKTESATKLKFYDLWGVTNIKYFFEGNYYL